MSLRPDLPYPKTWTMYKPYRVGALAFIALPEVLYTACNIPSWRYSSVWWSMNRICCSLTFWKLDLNFSKGPDKPCDGIQETEEMKRSWAIFGIDKNSLRILEIYFLYRSYLMIPKISSHTPPQELGRKRKRKVKWRSIPGSIHSIAETDFSS